MPPRSEKLELQWKKRADKLGFSAFSILDLDEFDDRAGQALRNFINQGHHGQMAWMKDTLERRVHPRALWEQANSAIILGMNYGPESDPLVTLDHSELATISVYARGRDYHDVIKGRLKELAGLIARDTDEDIKVFVDTAPLMEKPLAMAAGLGWQGKHTNLVSRDFGSWLFLGVILSAAKMEGDDAHQDSCGSCRACLDICPTDAFPAPYQLDARKCISYLTIEHDGPVDVALRPLMGNRIYGCDDCLAVCPWNKFAQDAHEAKLKAKEVLNAPKLEDLATLDDSAFRALFAGTPIKRIGRDRFIRNVLYAIGNSGRAELSAAITPHLASDNETVADAAHWAQDRLMQD